MYKIAVLSSTNGTNFQSIIDAKNQGKLEGVEISCLITDKADCGAVKKAEKAGIQKYFVDPKGKTREEFDRDVMKILDAYDIDLVILGGYMRIVGSEMVEKYRNRIINIHPSLLPKFAGGMNKSVHQAVLDAGEKETGMSIHIVDEGVDTGRILLQKTVEVSSDDTADSLKEKVQVLEKEWYPKVIRNFSKGNFDSL
jgi:phosphoribosylglycinamide formyltransferase-1